MPVSGRYGMGEYARASAIAHALIRRWPQAAVHFILSRAAPYAAGAPFPTTLLESSATFHTAPVIEFIRAWRPHVVIFDNAGRTAQLKAAHREGARIIYVSARRRQRRKAFRLRWMGLIDEHWIAYPEFIAGKLGVLERCKLKTMGRPVVRYLDVICSRASPQRQAAVLAEAGVAPGGYVLVVPGGGTGHPGAGAAAAQFYAAARTLAERGLKTLFVGPTPLTGDAPLAAQAPQGANLRALGTLPQADLAALMQGSRLVVANGGSTLLQSLACGAASIAVPIARDQAERIRRCVNVGVVLQAPLEAEQIAAAALALWDDEPARAALAGRTADLKLTDGVETALRVLGRFIDAEAPR